MTLRELTWRSLPALIPPNIQDIKKEFYFCGSSVSIIKDRAVLIGGKYSTVSEEDEIASIFVFHLQTQQWNNNNVDIQGWIYNRIGHTAVSWDDKIYLFGGERISCGSENRSILNDFQCLSNTQENVMEWEKMNEGDQFPEARSWHASCWVHMSTASSTTTSSTSTSSSECTKQNDNERLLILGGRKSDGTLHDDIWSYSRELGLWEMIQTTGDNPMPLCYHTATSFKGNTCVAVIGGYNGTEENRLISILDMSTFSWSTIENGSGMTCCFHAACRLFPFPNQISEEDSRIVIFGGQNESQLVILNPYNGDALKKNVGGVEMKSYLGHAMVSSLDGGKLYMFGGCDKNSNRLNNISYIDFWMDNESKKKGMDTMDGNENKKQDEIRKCSPNGDEYIGDYIDGIGREGYGQCMYNDGSVYSGNWCNDLKSGSGVFVYINGDKYEGDFFEDYANGFGVFTFENHEKTRYEGNWKHGKEQGSGTCWYRDGSVYSGEWLDGYRHGNGKFTYYSGFRGGTYEGHWEFDQPHGYGIRTTDGFPIFGESYEGNWECGKRTGKGTLLTNEGTEYSGDWKNDKKNGFGTEMEGKTKNVYEGKFVGGSRCGKGVCKYASGHIYKGQWLGNKRHGQGKMVYANKEVYDGTWKNDKREGNAIFTSITGTQDQEKWIDDQRIVKN